MGPSASPTNFPRATNKTSATHRGGATKVWRRVAAAVPTVAFKGVSKTPIKEKKAV